MKHPGGYNIIGVVISLNDDTIGVGGATIGIIQKIAFGVTVDWAETLPFSRMQQISPCSHGMCVQTSKDASMWRDARWRER